MQRKHPGSSPGWEQPSTREEQSSWGVLSAGTVAGCEPAGAATGLFAIWTLLRRQEGAIEGFKQTSPAVGWNLDWVGLESGLG